MYEINAKSWLKDSTMQIVRICCSGFTLASFVALSIAGTAASAETAPKAHYGGEYRAPLNSEPTTLDPALFSDIYAMQVANNLFDGLAEFDQDMNLVPAIAKRWKISRDHRTYTFILRPDVHFHNGRAVTAEDFVYSFTRLLDPELKSPAVSFFLNIAGGRAYNEGRSDKVSGLSAPKPDLLKIQLEKPFAPFISILAMANAKVVPKEAMGPEFGNHPIGTGAFRFVEWNPGEHILLGANPDYFAGRPYLDKVHFHIYPNIEWEQIFTDFQQGRLEHTSIPSAQYARITAQPVPADKYQFISIPGLNIVYVGMNLNIAPFNDVRVRQAINYAVDTQSIVEDITKRGTRHARGILPPGIAGFDPNFRGYGYDPERARALLAEAGYPDGAGFPTIRLWTVSKSEGVHKELLAYKHYLGEVGLNVEINTADSWKSFVQVINSGNAEMFYAAWYADYPDADNFFYPLAHSKSRTNRMRFQDAQVDELLERARTETDYLERAALYKSIEQRVMQNAPMVSQHINSNNYLFRSWVRGADMSHLGVIYLPLRTVWFDQTPKVAVTHQ